MLSAIFSPESPLIRGRGKSVPASFGHNVHFSPNFFALVHCNINSRKYMLHCTTTMVNQRCQGMAGRNPLLACFLTRNVPMQYTPDFEIPAPVREIATKSVEQAK